MVAEKMANISRHHQVICISHLSQIAAMADNHYLIEKKLENNSTITNIKKLSAEAFCVRISYRLDDMLYAYTVSCNEK